MYTLCMHIHRIFVFYVFLYFTYMYVPGMARVCGCVCNLHPRPRTGMPIYVVYVYSVYSTYVVYVYSVYPIYVVYVHSVYSTYVFCTFYIYVHVQYFREEG